MSLALSPTTAHYWRFPRVSGDEPFTAEDATGFEVFSPRERG